MRKLMCAASDRRGCGWVPADAGAATAADPAASTAAALTAPAAIRRSFTCVPSFRWGSRARRGTGPRAAEISRWCREKDGACGVSPEGGGSALDGTGEAADDPALGQEEEGQCRDHRQRGEREN